MSDFYFLDYFKSDLVIIPCYDNARYLDDGALSFDNGNLVGYLLKLNIGDAISYDSNLNTLNQRYLQKWNHYPYVIEGNPIPFSKVFRREKEDSFSFDQLQNKMDSLNQQVIGQEKKARRLLYSTSLSSRVS